MTLRNLLLNVSWVYMYLLLRRKDFKNSFSSLFEDFSYPFQVNLPVNQLRRENTTLHREINRADLFFILPDKSDFLASEKWSFVIFTNC